MHILIEISLNNITITIPTVEGEPKERLIDLGLGKELNSAPSGASHRIGTMQFMAIEVLQGKGRTYRHDLESFLYIFIWMCIRYAQDIASDVSEAGGPGGSKSSGRKVRPTKTSSNLLIVG
jgi:serine/threonine protein kinase